MKPVLIVSVIGAIFAAVAIPNLRQGLNRSNEKQTAVAVRDIADAWDSWQTDAKLTGPAVDAINWREMMPISADELRRRLVPKYMKALPERDGWGNKLDFAERGATYVIRSRGRDGIADRALYAKKRNTSFDDDVVYANGAWIQFSEGL